MRLNNCSGRRRGFNIYKYWPKHIFKLITESGSHLMSAQMVLSKQADWAAVDSTTLLYSKKFMQDGGKEIITLETLGRLPPYPIVVNSRLPGK